MDTIWRDSLPSASGPKYKRVADTIRKAALNGALKPGSKLPPVRDLAFRLKITPGTVARAYSILTDEGVLEAAVGRGTFVAPPKAQVPDDIWARELHLIEAQERDVVSLFSPRIADVGQISAMREAMRQVADADAKMFVNYPTRDAYRPVREAVVNWLSDIPLGPIGEEDVVLTHGGQNGLIVVLQSILRGPNPTILVEELSYAGFRRAAELLRANVVGVDVDEHGIIPQSLEEALKRTGAQVLCTSPEVHNPTGAQTPLARREQIVAIAERYNVQIVEDDCYRMGDVSAQSYRALAPDRGWHVSSISKTLTPALRVGFAIAPEGRGPDLRRAAEYGYFGLAQPLAELTRILLSDPATRDLVKKVHERMAQYVRIAVNALGRFDLTWKPDVPFLWLSLPSGWRAAAFCRAAAGQGVQIRSADEFALRDGRAPHAVRIAINAHITLEAFEGAMLKLQTLLDNPPEQISV